VELLFYGEVPVPVLVKILTGLELLFAAARSKPTHLLAGFLSQKFHFLKKWNFYFWV
jgi:hypothetical protein